MPVLKVKKNGTWEEVGSSSFVPQSNWNQNDTSALDYIKNRTHYTEIGQDGSETVHKLDEKYLPDGIVKTTDLKDYATTDFVVEKIEDTANSLTPADIGAAPESHGNHVPEVQTADNATFLRNDNTWQKITPENIGTINKNASNTMSGDLHYYGRMYINRSHGGQAKTVGNDTDPHVAKLRNSSLNTADTTPTEDGTICWTYK